MDHKPNDHMFLIPEKGGYRVVHDSELSTETEEIAKLLGKSTGLAVVDCSASMETIEILMKAVDLGCCIVLANKKPVTSTLVTSCH
jgi:homoserine dehydrogenase